MSVDVGSFLISGFLAGGNVRSYSHFLAVPSVAERFFYLTVLKVKMTYFYILHLQPVHSKDGD